MQDELCELLNEWRAPQPGEGLDRAVLASFRDRRGGGWWTARISLPAPVFAALLVCAAAGAWLLKPAPVYPPAHVLRLDSSVVQMQGGAGYVTAVNARGFRPLPHGAVTIISNPEARP